MSDGRTPRRRSGLVLPLFSCPSRASWGIGEIPDVVPVAAWLAGAGQRVWQLLPLNEMAPGQQSPYSAVSALAIDPIFIHVPAIDEFQAAGGTAALSSELRGQLAAVTQAPHVAYAAVRRLKQAAFEPAFERFLDEEWRHDTVRAQAMRGFLAAQGWWLADYALFRAIHAREQERA